VLRTIVVAGAWVRVLRIRLFERWVLHSKVIVPARVQIALQTTTGFLGAS
ncbi:hypothetical protein PanWU01x14_306140, partial [Parasponia andersonii]